jgi:mono/diheme cytochrome c family protein
MRRVYLASAFVAVLVLSVYGIRGIRFTHPPMDVFPEWLFPSMRLQPKYKPQGTSSFFADGRADRMPPAGTVPASMPLRDDDTLYLGKNPDGSWIRGFPAAIAVDRRLLDRGRERYAIYCAPCHGLVGDGNGVTHKYGMAATPTYHDDRLRKMAEGEIFNTVTNGKQPANLMPSYADKLTPQDRWAVIAYVRALQRAQSGAVADVAPGHRAELGLK